jgi:hypothetical protein
MFHLLVKYDGWASARDTIPRGRVFEYTDDNLTATFKPNGILDSQRISELPALLASETGVGGIQRAHVAHIMRTRLIGNEVSIDYAIDPDIPPISNAALAKISGELGFSSTELTRTHWAIKDADLFKVLLRHRPVLAVSPQVFKLGAVEEIDNSLVSVMMPFDSRFNSVYATLKEVAEQLHLKCLRADDIWENAVVIQDVVSLICRSKMVICDCTGRNANVFYEAGIAHTLGREVILITQSDGDIPFDLRHLRYLSYLDNNEGRQQLALSLKPRMQTILDER